MMIIFGIFAVLILIFIVNSLIQNGFKDTLKSLGMLLGLIIGLWLVFVLFTCIPAIYFLVLSILAIAVLEILISINNNPDNSKKTVRKGDIIEFLFLILIPFLIGTSVFAFSPDSMFSACVIYINQLSKQITGVDFPFRFLLQIFPCILFFTLIIYRNKEKDFVLIKRKDIKNIEREYKACYVVEDIKKTGTMKFVLSDVTGFALRFGFTNSSKKVIFIIYSVIGIIYDVLSFVLKESLKYESCVRGYLVTLISFSLTIFIINFANKCFEKYYKHVAEIKTKVVKYKSLNPEVDSLLSGRWYENAPLLIGTGIELSSILSTSWKVSPLITISPGLHSLVYKGAGEILNKKYHEYIKSKENVIMYFPGNIGENSELNDQEVKIEYKLQNNFYYPIDAKFNFSNDFIKSESKIFSVIDAKTNEEKASLIISVFDDFIQNCILKIHSYSSVQLLEGMENRLHNELPGIDYFIEGSVSLKPFEFTINYCGKELLRYNLVDCKDGNLAKTIEEICKKMTGAEFAVMLTNKFIELTEKTLVENKGLFSNFNEILSKNKGIFVK